MNDHTLILIVGAGPTGLTLACELARRNISFRIIEKSPTYQKGSRAKGLQPRSVEVFSDLGIVDELIAASNPEVVFRQFEGSTMISETVRKSAPRDDTRYQEGLMLPQWKVEEVLRKKLTEFSAEVEFGTELTELQQTEGIITAQLAKGDALSTLTCNYLVACDGGKSSIRKKLGINFHGETHETERALIGDVEVDGLVPDAWHIWLDKQYGIGIALCPFSCTKNWQLQAIMIPDENGNMPEANLKTFQKIFNERARMDNVTLKNCTWQSEYRVNVRMADRYRVGNAFIAGDAAHVHSIAGGLGMNTGIQDAYNLGWKLAAAIKGQSSPELLDTYEEERQPVAAWTLNISSERQKAMADALAKGKGGFETIGTKDTTQLNLNYRYSSLSMDSNAADSKLQAGDRAPDSELPDGSWLSDLYRGTHFTVITSKSVKLDDIRSQFTDGVKVYNLNDETMAKTGYPADAISIVRPDGYIGAIVSGTKEVVEYLLRFV